MCGGHPCPTWITSAGGRPSEGALLSRPAALAFLIQEIHEDVVTEGLGRGEEGTAPVHPHHALDELTQVEVVLEHERVDPDVVLGASLHLAQRHLDRQR